MKLDLLVENATVVTCAGAGGTPAAELGIIERGAVGIRAGRIAFVGATSDVAGAEAAETLNASGHLVLPGLVDPHTHLVFGGSRVEEFARRMAGEDYRVIAAEGGGIAATVRATRATSLEDLGASAARRAAAMRRHGTTSIEIKSGYGLTPDDEVRLLMAAREVERRGVAHVTTSFLGAHAIPPERRGDRDGYVDEVVLRMLPLVVEQRLADACDVYIDDGAFTLDEGRMILEAAKRLGLKTRAHVGQFADLGGARLLAELGALSADHLEQLGHADAGALAAAGVTAVLLPGAWRTLRQTPPDIEALRAAGVAIAVGTDCNPGTSPCTDLPLCAALAVRDAGLTLEEAVLAITARAADAAGLPDAGRLTVGSRGDLAIYELEDPRALAYALGGITAKSVVLSGRVVYDAPPGEFPIW
jgi:imidazolonepropionase